MLILEKNDNIKLNSEKKSYREPQLKEIGRVNQITRGGSGRDSVDNNWTASDPLNFLS